MRFLSNLKKCLLIGTVILLGCDVTLLFAADNNNGSSTDVSQSSNPQLQKLQAQMSALQNPTAPDKAPAGTASNASASPAASLPTASLNTLPSAVPATSPENINNAQLVPGAQNVNPLSSTAPATPASPPANIPPPLYQPNSPSSSDNNHTAQPINANSQALADSAAASKNSSNSAAISEKDVSDVAFNNMVQNSLPMSPDQIQKLRSAYMASQFAAASVPGTPPRPTATSVFADLSPGATPPVVRLGQGFVTSLVFVDTTGAPWPIESYDVGNPSAFNIQWDKVSNTLMIQSTVLYTYGNLAIRLKGLNTPVMITLIPGQKAIDYRVDMRVPGYGPDAKPFTANTLPEGSNPDLLNILDGVPPPNSTSLKVEGGNCQAWLSGQKMYVRTRLSILSPGWSATLSSADGMHAYQMQPTPMLLVSQNGQVIQLKVQGF